MQDTPKYNNIFTGSVVDESVFTYAQPQQAEIIVDGHTIRASVDGQLIFKATGTLLHIGEHRIVIGDSPGVAEYYHLDDFVAIGRKGVAEFEYFPELLLSRALHEMIHRWFYLLPGPEQRILVEAVINDPALLNALVAFGKELYGDNVESTDPEFTYGERYHQLHRPDNIAWNSSYVVSPDATGMGIKNRHFLVFSLEDGQEVTVFTAMLLNEALAYLASLLLSEDVFCAEQNVSKLRRGEIGQRYGRIREFYELVTGYPLLVNYLTELGFLDIAPVVEQHRQELYSAAQQAVSLKQST